MHITPEAARLETIRHHVNELAPSATSIWPNGLGFTSRGWEYTCHAVDRWTATRHDWIGHGETPTDAKANSYEEFELTRGA